MVNKYKSNAKKENIFTFFYNKWSILAVILSFSGFLYIFMYLKDIGKLDIFTQVSFYPHVVFSIVAYFFLLFFLCVSSVCFFGFLLRSSFNRGDGFVTFVENNKAIYTVLQPIAVLSFLGVLFLLNFIELDDESKKIVSYLLVSLYFLVGFCFYSFNNVSSVKSKTVLLCYSIFHFLSSIFVVVCIFIFSDSLNEDYLSFCILVSYFLLFLMFGNFVSIGIYDLDWRDYLSLVCMLYILLFLLLSTVGNKFNLQRIMLRPIGIAQTSSESGWYLVKNKDILDFFNSDYSIKLHKNIAGIENYYINGYLIFNIGNVRVICPHDFESVDSKKSNSQELDFSRCLSLTSEDIKFMKRGYPNKNSKDASDENIALMVAKTSMTIKNLMIMKNRMIIKNRMTVKDLMAVKNLITVKN